MPRDVSRPPTVHREVVYGRNPVLEALRAGRPLKRIFFAEGLRRDLRVSEIQLLAAKAGIGVQSLPRRELDSLAGGRVHQGVVAEAEPRGGPKLKDLLAGLTGPNPRLLLLDGITDPQNLGTVVRVADAAGVDAVIVPRRRSARPGPSVAKASSGAVEYVTLVEVANLSSAISALKESGFWVVCADPASDTTLYEVDLTGRLAVVLGAEGRGVSRLVRESCDFRVRIPMLGHTQSLNAAVAGAVVLYEAVRQTQSRPARKASRRGRGKVTRRGG